ncbi:MAG: DUF3795 domain-containing protein [Chloroflexia bacterium]|nr:DUF3795 domain-containing protein [Chloroflexia bacterium]
MERMVAYCGLICTDCPAFVATQADDMEALERVAAQWREEYDAPGITVESVLCDGCLGEQGRKCGHWSECEIRACAMGRGVANCGLCADYACERIEGFFGFVPDARAVLDGERKAAGL